MRARTGQLAHPEFAAFAAFAAESEMPATARWALPALLFAARLDRARTVVAPSAIGGPLRDAIARLYPRVRVLARGADADRVLWAEPLDGLASSARDELVASAAGMLAPDGLLVAAGEEACAAIEPLCARHGLRPLADSSRWAAGEGSVAAGRGRYGRAFAKGDPPAPGPTVAFAVLSWNSRDVILETLAACVQEADTLARLGHEAVILVCDNGSTDGTPGALRALDATIEAPHRFLFNENNRGISAARNQMIELALELGAGYVMVLDGDIEPVPFATYSMLRHLEEADSGVGAVYPSAERYVTRRERASSTLFGLPEDAVAEEEVPVCSGYALLRSAVFERGARYDESLAFGGAGWGFEDFDFAFQLRVHGFRGHSIHGLRFLHRYPGSSLDVMRKLGVDARGAARARRELLMRKWEGEPRVVDVLDFLRGLAVV